MQEKVGDCAECGEPVYCRGGFLQGVVRDDGSLVCLSCGDKGGNKRDQKND